MRLPGELKWGASLMTNYGQSNLTWTANDPNKSYKGGPGDTLTLQMDPASEQIILDPRQYHNDMDSINLKSSYVYLIERGFYA